MIHKDFKIFITIFVISFFSGYTYPYSDSLQLKLSLDKTEFLEGEDIFLNIEFEFKEANSTVYFMPFDITEDILLVNSINNIYRLKDYLMTLGHEDSSGAYSGPYIIFPTDSILLHQKKVLRLELNNDFSLQDTYWGKNFIIKENLPPGLYTVKYDDFIFLYLQERMLQIYANELKFQILKK